MLLVDQDQENCVRKLQIASGAVVSSRFRFYNEFFHTPCIFIYIYEL